MIKNFRRFLIVIYGLLFNLVIVVSDALARGGGGHGGGGHGGGSHGGGHHRGYYHSNGSSGRPLTERDFWFICGFAGFFAGIFVFLSWYTRHLILRKNKKVDEVLGKLAPYDREWDKTKLENMVRSAFFEIQRAWCAQNLERLKKALTPSLYSEWEDQLNFQQKIGQREFMEELRLDKIMLVEVKNYLGRDRDSFSACLDAGAVNYFLNDKGQFFAYDDASTPLKSKDEISYEEFTEYWTFERKGASDWLLARVDQEGDWAKTVKAKIVDEENRSDL